MATIAPDDPNDLAVNLTGLADFATRLRAEADQLRDSTTPMLYGYNEGVQPVGAGMPTKGMDQVTRHYRLAQARMLQQLDNFVLAGRILADAADRISQRYRNADDLAHMSLDDVKSALAAATAANPDPLSVPDTPDQPILINGEWAS